MNLSPLHCMGLAALIGGWPLIGGAATAPLELDLQTAVEMALARNYTIRVDRLAPEIARQDLRAAKSRFDPVLSASVGHSSQPAYDGWGRPLVDANGDPAAGADIRYDSAGAAVEGLTPLGTQYRVGIDTTTADVPGSLGGPLDEPGGAHAWVELTQPLLKGFGPGAQMAEIRVARNNVSASQWEFRQSLTDIVTQTILAYEDFYLLQENVEVARRNRDLAAGLLKENRRRVEIGSMAPIDTVVAEAELAQREEQLLLAESQLHTQANVLKALIFDRTPDLIQVRLHAARPPEPVPPQADPARDYQVALRQRPDYQQAALGLDNGELALRAARNLALPAVDLVGSYGRDGFGSGRGNAVSNVGQGGFDSYSVGVQVTAPWGLRDGLAQKAKARLQVNQQQVRLEQLSQAILLQLDSAWEQVQTNWRRIAAAHTARDLAEKGLQAEEKKLSVGTSTTYVVLQLQADLATAEIRQLRAIIDYRQSLALYDAACGITLQRHNIKTADN